MLQKEIKERLAEMGITGMVHINTLAQTLKMDPSTLYCIARHGHLHFVDRGVFTLQEVVDWLCENPRYLVRATAPTAAQVRAVR